MKSIDSQPNEGASEREIQISDIVERALKNTCYGDVDISGSPSDETITEFLIRYQNAVIFALYSKFNRAKTIDLRNRPPVLSAATLALWEGIAKEAEIVEAIQSNSTSFIEKYKGDLENMKSSQGDATPIRLND